MPTVAERLVKEFELGSEDNCSAIVVCFGLPFSVCLPACPPARLPASTCLPAYGDDLMFFDCLSTFISSFWAPAMPMLVFFCSTTTSLCAAIFPQNGKNKQKLSDILLCVLQTATTGQSQELSKDVEKDDDSDSSTILMMAWSRMEGSDWLVGSRDGLYFRPGEGSIERSDWSKMRWICTPRPPRRRRNGTSERRRKRERLMRRRRRRAREYHHFHRHYHQQHFYLRRPPPLALLPRQRQRRRRQRGQQIRRLPPPPLAGAAAAAAVTRSSSKEGLMVGVLAGWIGGSTASPRPLRR